MEGIPFADWRAELEARRAAQDRWIQVGYGLRDFKEIWVRLVEI